MKRIKLKKHKKVSPFTYILVLILIFVISLIIAFKYIGDNLSNKVNSYATKQAKKIITLVINKSVNKEVISKFDTNEIFKENENMVDFNSATLNEILLEVSSNLRENLKKLEKGEIKIDDTTILTDKTKLKDGVIYEIPSGIIFNNALLSNVGPKIPVKLHLLGDVVTSIDTKVTDYGINNAIIEVDLKIVITEQVILPFSDSQIKIVQNVPLAIKLIEGKIPNYYSNGKDGTVLIGD